ncbi:MAG: hypothetical protein A2Y12_00165 [Planctomycetes bacterium GWF2_42_9]|nr:MAG: hypothetical protein A2Y12_00165 [Planctomycetes bacterium GWF2_42_9]
MEPEIKPENFEALKLHTMFIAMVIRNAMEDFHCKYLSDAQMKELNPIIRNAVFTALYAQQTMLKSERSLDFVNSNIEMVPNYWEQPEFLKGFKT